MSFEHILVDEKLAVEAFYSNTTASLITFATAVAKEIRGVRFQEISGSYNELGVCLGDSPYVACVIGYDVYFNSDDAVAMYGVTSRTIQNRRYSSSSKGYYQKASLNMATAVKNVCRHIRAYSPEEVAKATWRQVREDTTSDRDTRGSVVFSLGRKIDTGFPTTGSSFTSQLDRELAHLVAIGHTFVSQEFAANVVAYVEAREENRLDIAREPELSMVWIRHTPEGVMYDCVRGAGTSTNPHVQWQFTEETLPERVTEFIAVLDMVPVHTYVPEVGRKFAANLYYVPWE